MTEQHDRPSRARALRATGAVALVVAAGLATISAVGAEPAASKGAFHEYESGPGLGYSDVAGHAQLVRAADGRTIVTVELQGLQPETTYAVHVHDLACSDHGGHTMFSGPVAGGAAPAGNEIWPGPITSNAAGNARGSTVVDATAPGTARSVVVHATPTGGARIACADLS